MDLRTHSAFASFVVAAVVAGCGGGGGGDNPTAGTASPAPQPTVSTGPQPSAPLAAYVAHGEGGIGTVIVDVGANGVLKMQDETISIQNTGTDTCAVTTHPASTDTGVCNRFADGKAYLFCSNNSGSSFDVVMFRQADVQPATVAELAGLTLQGRSCGSNGLRAAAGFSLAISANGQQATEVRGNSTWMYPAADMAAPNGQPTTPGQRQRWAIYKVAASGGTQYFVSSLWQSTDTGEARPPNLYFLQK